MKKERKWNQYSFFIMLLVAGLCFFGIDDFRSVVYAGVTDRSGASWGNVFGEAQAVPGDALPGREPGGDAQGPGQSGTGETGTAGETKPGGEGSISAGDNGSTDGRDTVADGTADGTTDGTGQGVDANNGENGQPAEGGEISAPASWHYATVTQEYFDDAVFIGDSRTVGLHDYSGMDNSTFYSSTGLTIYKMFSAPIVQVEESKKKITIEEALSNKQFGKIYLMIGINEMGTGTVDTFMQKYEEQVKHLRELQPNAVIYLQGILRVTSERSAKGDYIHNSGIDARNGRIAGLADNETIFYLDVNPVVCDETGGMIPSYSFDGVHLKAEYISVWKQFLMEHAVEWDIP